MSRGREPQKRYKKKEKKRKRKRKRKMGGGRQWGQHHKIVFKFLNAQNWTD